jgi:hypothetical protein
MLIQIMKQNQKMAGSESLIQKISTSTDLLSKTMQMYRCAQNIFCIKPATSLRKM